MRSSNSEDIVPVGRITGAHGIRGEVRLMGYSPLDGLDLEVVFLTGGRAGARTGGPLADAPARSGPGELENGSTGIFGTVVSDGGIKPADSGKAHGKKTVRKPFASSTVEAGPFEYVVKRSRYHKGHFILELEGVTDRNTAEALVGCEVSVKRADLPELDEDEFYCDDLIGMEVVADDGRYLGKVTEIMPTGSNDVFVVNGPFGEVLIPAIEASEIKIDTNGRTITVHLLEGLLPDEKTPDKRL